MTIDHTDDIRAIEALIARQFGSLCWKPGTSADWGGFSADFLPGASLFPSARPAKPQSVAAFVERMRNLSEQTLRTFDEVVLGTHVQVFGNVAVAIAAAENTENGAETNQVVEMLLLVKEEGVWKVAAQAWDKVTADHPLPTELGGMRH